MKTQNKILNGLLTCSVMLLFAGASSLRGAPHEPGQPAGKSAAILLDQLGAVAGKQYSGDGLAVDATPQGAHLRCVFQKLEGEATSEGLWLTSTVSGGNHATLDSQPSTNRSAERFRVKAIAMGREQSAAGRAPGACAEGTSGNRPAFQRRDPSEQALSREATAEFAAGLGRPFGTGSATRANPALKRWAIVNSPFGAELPATGTVSVADKTVRFTRPGLVEEYSVSMDGVRQDFVVMEKPPGEGELRVCLEVTGAQVRPAPGGAELVLEPSGRKIVYNRLRATDPTGRELPARIEVGSACDEMKSLKEYGERVAVGGVLAVLVNDTGAAYPIRIDPTFSDANWISLGGIPGADGPVYAMVLDESGDLYIGGRFSVVGDILANNIAKWDGTRWSNLGAGIAVPPGYPWGGWISALAASGSNLYAGGVFTTAGGVGATNIAKWDGHSWSALGSGVSGGASGSAVYALAVSGNDLYAGGAFAWAGGISATNIAKWDGANWTALGSGLNGGVVALAVSGSDMYVGGGFTTAGGVGATNIAKWDGANWSALGSGLNGVRALAVSGSNVYAAGGNEIWPIGGHHGYTARWDGSSWSKLGSGMDYPVEALVLSGSNVYAGGWFTTVDGHGIPYLAKWDGGSWSAVDLGINERVSALVASGSDLYAGGDFTIAGGIAANRIAKWDGCSWSALGLGMGGVRFPVVSALAVSGSDLYAGGEFTAVGGIVASNIVKWDGSRWSALGSGISGSVSALAVSGGELYAGGEFTMVGGLVVNSIAKWDGSGWSALGSGMNGGVLALAPSDGALYAGGWFTSATNDGGIAIMANYVAKWDGSNWSALGSGMNNTVRALAVAGSDVYAGGNFTMADGTWATFIAKWDGSKWSALGSGITAPWDAYVNALAVLGSEVYAGGVFTNAGGIVASNIAKWDGSSWSALGQGINGEVYALAVSGSDMYVGGSFRTAGGIPANCIAKWDGSGWSALGSGVKYSVSALTISDSELFAGGYFEIAGGKVSAYAARAIINPGNWLTIRRGVPGPHTNTLTYVGVPGAQYVLQFATNLTTSPWFTLATNTAAANGRGTVQDPAASDPQRFYRVSEP